MIDVHVCKVIYPYIQLALCSVRVYKNSVWVSESAHSVCITIFNRSILFREIIAASVITVRSAKTRRVEKV